MKKLFFILISLPLLFISCGKINSQTTDKTTSPKELKNCVEILYFHGDMKCKNCYAMEKYVTELLNDEFKKEVKDGKIVFKKIDITSPEGEKIADNYEVAWSSLFINNWNNGKEERRDMTRFGMQNAVKNTEVFKKEIASIIKEHLKNH